MKRVVMIAAASLTALGGAAAAQDANVRFNTHGGCVAAYTDITIPEWDELRAGRDKGQGAHRNSLYRYACVPIDGYWYLIYMGG